MDLMMMLFDERAQWEDGKGSDDLMGPFCLYSTFGTESTEYVRRDPLRRSG